MLETIVRTFEKEQDHSKSDYYFRRDTDWEIDTLTCDGKGSPVGITGMIWSGFRPSEDSCRYYYLIPAIKKICEKNDLIVERYLPACYDKAMEQPCCKVVSLPN